MPPVQNTNAEVKNIKTDLRWVNVVVLVAVVSVIAISSAYGGYVYGTQKQQPNDTSAQNESAISVVLNPTPTKVAAPKRLVSHPKSNFQEALQSSCETGKKTVDKEKLPILFSTPLQEQEIECYFDENFQAGFLYNQKGIWPVEIFDQYSPDPQWMGHTTFQIRKYSLETSDPDIEFEIYLSSSDSINDNIIGQQSVLAYMVRTIVSKSGEIVYVRYIDDIIPAKDKRLVSLLQKYARYNKEYEGYEIEDYDAAKNEMKQAFFSNMNNLAEPERSNLQKMINVVSAISLKEE